MFCQVDFLVTGQTTSLGMPGRSWLFVAVAIVVIAASGMATMAIGVLPSQSKVTNTPVMVTLKGTIADITSDCATNPRSTSTCPFFNVTVLRATDGYTYALEGLPSGTNWFGQCVGVTGRHVVPSIAALGLIRGNLSGSSIGISTGC